jgi:hypothetical protein
MSLVPSNARGVVASACVFFTTLGFATTVACSSKSTGASTPSTCAPFTAAPVSLPAVLGVGKDKGGALYVAAGLDDGTPEPRIFLVESGELREQQIVGASLGTSDFNLTFVEANGNAASGRNLLLHLVNGKATAMALGTPSTKGIIGDPSEANDEVLTLQDPGVIARLGALGLPALPEQIARTDNGMMLVVSRSATEGVPLTRVFYGTAGGTLFERRVTEVGAEAQDQGILFVVDGAGYGVNFHYKQQWAEGGASTSNITGELGTPTTTRVLTILPTSTSPRRPAVRRPRPSGACDPIRTRPRRRALSHHSGGGMGAGRGTRMVAPTRRARSSAWAAVAGPGMREPWLQGPVAR